MSESKAKEMRSEELSLPKYLEELDKIQKNTIEGFNIYHTNVKSLVDQLIQTIENKSRIIKP